MCKSPVLRFEFLTDPSLHSRLCGEFDVLGSAAAPIPT